MDILKSLDREIRMEDSSSEVISNSNHCLKSTL